jgi:hypothetical protein
MVPSLRWILPASVVALAGLAGCTATSPQPQPPAPTVAVTNEPAGASVDMPAGTGTAPVATSTPEAPKSDLTNEPPAGGRVTSNAGTTPAGSDRMQPMMDLIKANRDGFRKCFDLWGKKNPGQAGKIAFQFFLKADGSLQKAEMKRDEGDVHAVEVENCMIAFAKTLTYPKSTVGMETVYTHRFEFKAASK